jgi:transposase-like protein
MEKFKLVCKVCGSENVKFKLSVEESTYKDAYANLEIVCKSCKTKDEIEEIGGEFTK